MEREYWPGNAIDARSMAAREVTMPGRNRYYFEIAISARYLKWLPNQLFASSPVASTTACEQVDGPSSRRIVVEGSWYRLPRPAMAPPAHTIARAGPFDEAVIFVVVDVLVKHELFEVRGVRPLIVPRRRTGCSRLHRSQHPPGRRPEWRFQQRRRCTSPI